MFNDSAALDPTQVVAGITTIGEAGIDADIGWLASLIIPSASASASVLAVGVLATLAVVRGGGVKRRTSDERRAVRQEKTNTPPLRTH